MVSIKTLKEYLEGAGHQIYKYACVDMNKLEWFEIECEFNMSISYYTDTPHVKMYNRQCTDPILEFDMSTDDLGQEILDRIEEVEPKSGKTYHKLLIGYTLEDWKKDLIAKYGSVEAYCDMVEAEYKANANY